MAKFRDPFFPICNTSISCEDNDFLSLKAPGEKKQASLLMTICGAAILIWSQHFPWDQTKFKFKGFDAQHLLLLFLIVSASQWIRHIIKHPKRPHTVILPSVAMPWWGRPVAMAISSGFPFDVSEQLFPPMLYHTAHFGQPISSDTGLLTFHLAAAPFWESSH